MLALALGGTLVTGSATTFFRGSYSDYMYVKQSISAPQPPGNVSAWETNNYTATVQALIDTNQNLYGHAWSCSLPDDAECIRAELSRKSAPLWRCALHHETKERPRTMKNDDDDATISSWSETFVELEPPVLVGSSQNGSTHFWVSRTIT